MKKTLCSLALACAALPAAQAVTVRLTPALAPVGVGGSVSLDLVISGLTAAGEIASGYQFTVLYDTTLLDLAAVSPVLQFDVPFGGVDSLGGFDTTTVDGQIAMDMVSFLSDADLEALPQGDGFTMATLTFTGAVAGAALVDFGASPLFDRNVTGRTPQGATTPSLLDVTFEGSCIVVGGVGVCAQADVPEPASYGLVALALIAAGAASRRQRKGVAAG